MQVAEGGEEDALAIPGYLVETFAF